jgi:hypothetical protein
MSNVAKLKDSAADDFVYAAHPFANQLPMMTGSPKEELKLNIKAHGILEPIWLYQGMILDGRNRYACAKEIGHVFTSKDFREWSGTPADAEAWAISTNFHRRQLTNAQKQEVIQTMIKKNPTLGDREIARLCSVSHSTVGTARDKLANSPEAPFTSSRAMNQTMRVADFPSAFPQP